MQKHKCPVCGYPNLMMPPYEPWGENQHLTASHEICPSCGFQFGVTDADKGFALEAYREVWIAQGCPWWFKSEPPPDGWDPAEQLKALILE